MKTVRWHCYVTEHACDMMLTLWLNGRDTYDIARALGFPEYEVSNRLPVLRERRRLNRERRECAIT